MAFRPTREFRAEPGRLAWTGGLPRRQVAADFGVGFATLSRGIQQDRRKPQQPIVQSGLDRDSAEPRSEKHLPAKQGMIPKRPPGSLRSKANELRPHRKDMAERPAPVNDSPGLWAAMVGHAWQTSRKRRGCFRASMSGTGNCQDNAAVETF